ncbi:MAG: M23 family metallopeptidase [Maritimibacter sp.]|nr:M23 family metallopeptidase [Maritimibacter sp.]
MEHVLRTAALLVGLLPAALQAQPELGLPIDCTLGDDCFVMNHLDSDPGPGAEDFTCGPETYDGHEGTDFAVNSFAAMRAGVAVLAAADGEVRALRDGMPDLGLAGTPPDLLDGQECGNGVLIDHGDGWETQYCHLRDGSVAVAEGDRVARGDRIGLVGFSGHTEFPHVHIGVRHDGAVIDPFDTDEARVCGADDGPEDDLWAAPPGYRAGGVVAAGLFDAVPDYDAVKDGTAHRDALPADAPALVGWALVHAARPGDVVEITLTAPDGTVYDRHAATLEKTQALAMRAAGRKRPDGGWAPGDWTVAVRLIRDGNVLETGEALTRVGG